MTTSPTEPTSSGHARTRADRVDRLLSLCAGIAAVTAVAVSLYQAALARQQLRASAWPYVQQQNSYTQGAPYRYLVSNEGVGPARVRSFVVLADGKPVPRWNDAVRAFTGDGEPGLVYSSFTHGSVVPAGAERELVQLPPGERAHRFWLAAQTRLRTILCYCSVYDECWLADSDEKEPAPVRACPVEAGREFRE